MSDPWTDAWEEAEASPAPDVKIYYTLEFQHPAFLDGSPLVEVPIRVVTNVADDMDFGIELGADFDAGEMATFTAIPFRAERATFSEGKMPECEVTIDNVNREMVGYLEAAVQVKADLVVLFREYRSDDLTEPCYGPITFKMRKIAMKGATLTGVAKLDDLSSRNFPFLVYSPTDFPGLSSS